MDSATQAALYKWKDEIIASVSKTLKDELDRLNNHMTQIFDMRMSNIEKDMDSLQDQFRENYEEMKSEKDGNLKAHSDILKEVDHKINELRNEVSGLDRRQSTDEGIAKGVEAAGTESFNQKSLWIGVAGIILGAITFFIGANI